MTHLQALRMQRMAAFHNRTTSNTQLSQLPIALTARILQHVDQRQRLASCAVVCRAWHVAAAQATVHVECAPGTHTDAAPLEAWLAQHGTGVETLDVQATDDVELILRLPWGSLSALQDLSLSNISLPAIHSRGSSPFNTSAPPAAGGGSLPSAHALLPHLKALCLDQCRLHSTDCFVQLSSSSKLTRLVVVGDTWPCSPGQAASLQVWGFGGLVVASQLQSLSLSRLKLPLVAPIDSDSLDDNAKGSSQRGTTATASHEYRPLLLHLKQLQLDYCHMHSPGCRVQLASSPALTSLEVRVMQFTMGENQLDSKVLCLLQHLPRLRLLSLPNVSLSHVAASKPVARMRGLQDLTLRLKEDTSVNNPAAGFPSSLTRLSFSARWDYTHDQPVLPPQLHLTSLQVLRLDDVALVPGVLASVPQLRRLQVVSCDLLPDQTVGLSVLLGVLPVLTQLQHLHIENIYGPLDVEDVQIIRSSGQP